ALFVDARGAEGNVAFDGGVVRLVRGGGEKVDEPFPIVLRAVELLEPVPIAAREIALAQNAERLGLSGRDLEDAPPPSRGIGRIAPRLGLDDAELLQRRGLRGRAGRCRYALLEPLGERSVILLALGLLLERVEDARRVRVELEDLLLQCNCVGAAVEPL